MLQTARQGRPKQPQPRTAFVVEGAHKVGHRLSPGREGQGGDGEVLPRGRRLGEEEVWVSCAILTSAANGAAGRRQWQLSSCGWATQPPLRGVVAVRTVNFRLGHKRSGCLPECRWPLLAGGLPGCTAALHNGLGRRPVKRAASGGSRCGGLGKGSRHPQQACRAASPAVHVRLAFAHSASISATWTSKDRTSVCFHECIPPAAGWRSANAGLAKLGCSPAAFTSKPSRPAWLSGADALVVF